MKIAVPFAAILSVVREWNAMESASAAVGMLTSTIHRLPGGGACAGQAMTATQVAVAVAVNIMLDLQT